MWIKEEKAEYENASTFSSLSCLLGANHFLSAHYLHPQSLSHHLMRPKITEHFLTVHKVNQETNLPRAAVVHGLS